MAIRTEQEQTEAQPLTIVSCKLCNEENLAWVESKRTGKRYLADVGYAADGETLKALAWMPHRCPEIEARRAKAEQEAEAAAQLDTDGQQNGTDPDYEDPDNTYDGPTTSEVDEDGNDELMQLVKLDPDEPETIAEQGANRKARRGAKAKLDADE